MVARQNLKIYNNNSNQEFEKLLNDNLTNSGIIEHTIVKGTIEKIEDKYITVYCVGAKSSGVIEKSEIPQSELDTVEVGKEIEVYVERTENRDGEIVLSIEKARRARSWKKIKEAYEIYLNDDNFIDGKQIKSLSSLTKKILYKKDDFEFTQKN